MHLLHTNDTEYAVHRQRSTIQFTDSHTTHRLGDYLPIDTNRNFVLVGHLGILDLPFTGFFLLFFYAPRPPARRSCACAARSC